METAPAPGGGARERETWPDRGDLTHDAARPPADHASDEATEARDGDVPTPDDAGPRSRPQDVPAGPVPTPDDAGPRPRPEGVPAGPRWWRWWG